MDSQMPLLKLWGGPKFWAKSATNKCGKNWALNMTLEGFKM
jgi:hypothetical protein